MTEELWDAEPSDRENQGEGNRSAAREYNQAQRRFVSSGRVRGKAREAEQALDGPERKELDEAEAIGKSHVAEDDPQVRLSNQDRIKTRAYEIWEGEGRPKGKDLDHWLQAEGEVATEE